ncbi:MAG: response regulator [Candidatus Eremiobacterota bacterium]
MFLSDDFLQSLNIINYSMSPLFHIKYINKAIENISGRQHEDFLKNPSLWMDIIHRDDIETVKKSLKLYPFDITYRIVHINGDIKWMINRGTMDKEGDIINGIAIDITEQKQIEENFKNKIQSLFLDNITLQTWYLTDEKTYGGANRSHASFLGIEEKSFPGKSLYSIFPHDIAEKFVKTSREVFQSGETLRIEEWMAGAGGELSLFSVTKIPILAENGHIEGIVCSAEDITDRKLVEKVLMESEEIFRMISISAQDAIIIIDSAGLVTHWNPAAEKILGYSEIEILGETLENTLVPAEYREIYNSILSVWQKTGACDATGKCSEIIVLRKDGSEINVEMSLSSVKLQEQWHAIGIIRDITERKSMELLLKKQTEELINTNQLLLQAKEDAEIANRTKSQFVANMSHEIRTPMNGVIGMTSLLLNTGLTEEQLDYTETIRKSADALLLIINDILDFSKIEAGKIVLESSDFSIIELMEDTSDLLALKAHEKNIEFNYFIYRDVPNYITGDHGKVRQILINLCNNAIKFTEKGEVMVRIIREEEKDNKVTIKFSVSDTGIGISEEQRNRLFKPFSQVDGSTTRKYGGTGLGLVISKKLAEMMGGTIGVESKEGAGSTFWFTAVFEKTIQPEEEFLVITEELKKYRFLIIDDNETNRFILKEYLKTWGCRFDEAPGGIQALVKFYQACEAHDPFEIALLDMQMPEMDGLTLARQIKLSPQLKGTALLLLTSMDRRFDLNNQENVFDACLNKPIKQSNLLNTLLAIIGKQRLQKEESSQDTGVKTEKPLTMAKNKYHVLVVEDNYINQKVALRILNKLGYSADSVGNGKEAIKALGMVPYDIVLMDIQMPEMNGFEATELIRNPASRVLNHHIPVIAMTAHSMKGDREKCMEAGMNNYIAKPVKIDEVAQILEKELSLVKIQDKRKHISVKENSKIFDWKNMLARLDGDEEFAIEILRDTIEDTDIKKLRQLSEENNIDELITIAHSLKGVYANIDAFKLKETVYEIELTARQKKLDMLEPLISKLEYELEQFKKTVSHIVLKDLY